MGKTSSGDDLASVSERKMYMYIHVYTVHVRLYLYNLEHSYSEYCNLIGQGVVYKSHINHETWLISARGTYKPRRPSPHVQCPYIATT